MATVWRAYDLEREASVALKLVRGSGMALVAQRLQREARATASVEHPAIVRVLDAAVTAEGVSFLVMELLSGETLCDLLARERISAVRAVQLLLPIIDALDAVHAHGVVHRDLKPSNVFLATNAQGLQPRLVDFGIAKLMDGAPRLTGSGLALGSPSYMSPEQARGDDVDFRSDIWSMCVLLYRTIGDCVPFRGKDTRTILDAILRQPAPALPLGAGVDEHLSRVVMSGLSKDPSSRPASMRQLGEQLARWLLLHGVSVDACGAALVPKWLSSEEPPPLSERSAATTRKVPHLSLSPVKRLVPARRRWILWAAAGVLVAGASLALSKSAEPPAATEQSVLARNEAASPPSSPPQKDAALAAAEVAEASPRGITEPAHPPPPSSSNAAPAARGRQRSNQPPLARRPQLPF